MQIDCPRWPSGAVTKTSINTKKTISQEPECFLYEASFFFFFFFFLQFGITRWLPFAVTKNITEHENDNISIEPLNGF